MRHRRWIAAASVGAALMIAWLALRGQGERERPSVALTAPAVSMASPRPSSPRVNPALAASPRAPLEIPPAKREEIASCLERNPRSLIGSVRDLRTLDELLRQLAGGGEPAEAQVLFSNIHILRPDGIRLRLHLVPGETDSARRIRVFSVDNEGLPVPEPLPSYLAGMSGDEAAARFREQGNVTFENRRMRERLGSDLAVNVTRENGRVVELQVFFAGHSLGCAWSGRERPAAPGLECSCL